MRRSRVRFPEAAPGGKALELSRSAGTVVAVDRSFTRLTHMTGNFRRVEARNIQPLVVSAFSAT